MISFSADPNAAEQEMRAVIYYLTAFGFVDGTFDVSEMGFVLRFVRELVEARARDARGITEAVRAELVDRWSRHFEEVAEEVAREIDAHTKEPVAEGEADGAFVMTRVKLRCFELFTRFDEESRARLLAIAEQMIAADGVVHPEELRFRDELHALLDAPQQLDDAEVEVALEEVNAKVSIHAPARRPVLHDGHEFLTHGEWDYPSDPEGFAREADRDVHLAERLIKRLDAARARGAGRLQGARDFRDFSSGEGFLDGHVHVLRAPEGTESRAPGHRRPARLLLVPQGRAPPGRLLRQGGGPPRRPGEEPRDEARAPRRLHRPRALQLQRGAAGGDAARAGGARRRVRAARQPRVLRRAQRQGARAGAPRRGDALHPGHRARRRCSRRT
jgi:hypothetical protein